ncbi:MAG: DUF1343 domain-containing protein [Chitinophagaceae bacterium]|nr:DUF1343 domain-containing protein [Chitinophagaceae bacterium]
MLAFGVDQIIQLQPAWKDQKIGLVTNHAAKTMAGKSSRQALIHHHFNIVKLFSPEHGLEVKGEDGIAMADGIDSLTKLPIISLYGKKLTPDEDDMASIDVLVFDIPDVGCRFYTYLWTLSLLLETAAKYHKPLIVLDRPNPVSGDLNVAEGPIMDDAVSSFVGRWPIPIRHSCTLGELANYFNITRGIGCNLEVIKCLNWDRTQYQPAWGIPFVPTSPAIRSFESMLLYSGLCLLEATNISIGRGTSKSFRVAGAPWINGTMVANAFNRLAIDEVEVTPITFYPAFSKHAGNSCNGVEFHVTQPNYFQSVTNGLLFINLIHRLYPTQFSWSAYPTEVNPLGNNHLDKLLGVINSESLFDLPMQQFIATITRITAANDWKQEILPYLLY